MHHRASISFIRTRLPSNGSEAVPHTPTRPALNISSLYLFLNNVTLNSLPSGLYFVKQAFNTYLLEIKLSV